MRAVLGIDAAWTSTKPSGVALVSETPTGWELIAVEPSYRRFQTLTPHELSPDDSSSRFLPAAHELLACSRTLCGRSVDLVAIDMPLSNEAINGRRESDNAVSRAYGGRKCGTHTPSASRPGRISDELTESFEQAGYSLQTTTIAPPGLIEVYPHPALVELFDAPERLPYKASKLRIYWPKLSPEERRASLYRQWKKIVARLDSEISGVAANLSRMELGAGGAKDKAYEDCLDAIICAWVGICALRGRAKPFGDHHSAIWIPLVTGRNNVQVLITD